jgi:molybdenum cofactor cytidylyltransferase
MISSGTRMPEIVVLAAGSSSRLGRNKALVKVRGISVLGIQLAKLSSLTRGKPYVVIPSRSAVRREVIRHGGTCIFNSDPARGMSNSVRRALRCRRFSQAVLVMPVDLVALRSVDVKRMLRMWEGNRRKVIARRLGTRGVTPVILPKRLFHLAETITGDVGLRDLIAGLPTGERRLITLPSAGLDIDTKQDLSAARRRFGAR